MCIRDSPGKGGWGALLTYGDNKRELCGGEKETTNNRMEMMAAIKALQSLKRQCNVALYTDSTYLRKGVLEWMKNWKKNGWKTAAKKPVKNEDLWKQLDKLVELHNVTWSWVKGHSGHKENEQVDQLANDAIDKMLS